MKKPNEVVLDYRLVEALVEVRSMVPLFQDNRANYPHSRKLGICGNVFASLRLQGLVYEEYSPLMHGLHEVMQTWVSRDKNSEHHPVGGYDEYQGEAHVGKLWFNKRRLELLDWLIKEVTFKIETAIADGGDA